MKKLIVPFVLMLTLLSSCYYGFYPQTGSSVQTETNAESIQIYSGDIQQDYEIIGSITVDVMGKAEKASKYLKKKAAKVGADAVIHVELNKVDMEYQRTGISGIAVKLK